FTFRLTGLLFTNHNRLKRPLDFHRPNMVVDLDLHETFLGSQNPALEILLVCRLHPFPVQLLVETVDLTFSLTHCLLDCPDGIDEALSRTLGEVETSYLLRYFQASSRHF